MNELLSRFTSDDLCGVLFLGGCLVVGIVSIVAACWYRLRKAEIAAHLKLEMLNRGMSADEIKIVLEAGSNK